MSCPVVYIWLLVVLSILSSVATRYVMKDLRSVPSVTPQRGIGIGWIDISDRMTFSMDITVFSWPTSGWAGIFQIGSHGESGFDGEFYPRHPAIQIYKNNLYGFTFAFTNQQNENDYYNILAGEGNIVLNQKYKIVIEWSQSSLVIKIGGVTFTETIVENYSYPPYDTVTDAIIWVSHPSLAAANALIENFKIQIPVSLCLGYSGYYPEVLVGKEFEYIGEIDSHGAYRNNNLQIQYHPADARYFLGGFIQVNDENLWLYTYTATGNDEVDSIYGSEWNEGMLLSAGICGLNDPNIPHEIGNVVPVPLIYVILIFIGLTLLLTIYNCHGLRRKDTLINNYVVDGKV